MAEKRALRLLRRDLPPIVNPKPCGCCQHGHAFAALELTIRHGETGAVLKRMTAVPGGFREEL